MNAGIDYGMGKSNIDTATGIRFGVINPHTVDYWYENSDTDFGDPTCPKCGGKAEDSHNVDVATKDYYCAKCEESYWSDACFGDEGTQVYASDKFKAHESSLGIFVTQSPFYTFARFCSPCCPGAGDLNNTEDDGVKTYCFGHDWFEDGKAPYPVYSVETGELVQPSE